MSRADTIISIARSFLDLMEDRQVDKAQALVDPSFLSIFPGDRQFTSLEELADCGEGLYLDVRKQHDLSLYVPADTDGVETAIFYGTLKGTWADGTPFEGIRFTDRFRLRDSRIIEQQVWNDMGEARLRIAGLG